MRLIDADALFRDMEKAQWYNNADRDEIAEELVLNAPTIESQRKNGKWIDSWRSKMDGTRYWYRECDHCGYERDDCDPEKDSNFCPNCGFDMREEGGADADVES